jgi:hypothetical protein
MVYNALSYRRWATSPIRTLRHFWSEQEQKSAAWQRKLYDADPAGAAAPHTDFVSIAALRRMCGGFSPSDAALENITDDLSLRLVSRKTLLKTPLPKLFGLDIYVRAVK